MYDRSIHAQYTRYTVYRLPMSLCTYSIKFESSLSCQWHCRNLHHCISANKIQYNLIADQRKEKRKLIHYTTPPSAAGFQTAELSITDGEIFRDWFKQRVKV